MLLLNKTLLRMSHGIKGHILGIVLLRLLVLAATVEFAQSVSSFLGDLFDPQMTGASLREAILSAALSALVLLVGQVLIGEAEYLCTAKARTVLRDGILDKLFTLDVSGIEQVGAANAVNLAVTGVESMQAYYSAYLPALIYCFAAPVYMFFRLYPISAPVAWVLLVVTMSILPLNNLFRKITERLKAGYWNGLHELTGSYLEGLRGMTTLKLFNRDGDRNATLQAIAYRFYGHIMDVMRLNFRSFLLTYSLMYGAIFVSLVLACRALAAGGLTLTDALLVLMLSFSFFSSVRELSNATHNALTGVAAAQNVATLFDIPVDWPFDPPAAEVPFEQGIRFEGVTFGYEGRRNVLKDVDLFFETGKTTAVVGASGSGKSTIASLLLRFQDPNSGRLLFEGRPYTQLSLEELRRRVMMVPQRVSLFSGTVGDNLRMAAPDATDQQLWQALSDVGLADWLRTMPQGLLTDVGDAGAKLSGGQRQKMGIARALLSGAPCIIFDEATSSVDMESERDIWRCIDRMAESHTLILISHRLSTIRDADCIYVLSEGEIAGAGRHEALLQDCPLYARMVAEQNQLERIGQEVSRFAAK